MHLTLELAGGQSTIFYRALLSTFLSICYLQSLPHMHINTAIYIILVLFSAIEQSYFYKDIKSYIHRYKNT